MSAVEDDTTLRRDAGIQLPVAAEAHVILSRTAAHDSAVATYTSGHTFRTAERFLTALLSLMRCPQQRARSSRQGRTG